MSIDLTEAIEAAAAAYFNRIQAARLDDGRKRPDGKLWQWSDLTKHDQYAYRVLVLPIVAPALPSIARQAWADGHETDEHGAGNCECPNPYEKDTL